jgi:hypothetical protein
LPPDEQVLGRAVAEVARVLHVERDRVGAAQLVADVLGHDRRLDAELASAPAPRALRISPMFTSAMRTLPCASRSTSSSCARSSGSMPEHEALGDDRDAVAAAVAQALDDGADQRVDDAPSGGCGPPELLGDERQRRARRLADAEREVAGLAPIAMTKYQREVVLASTIRFLTISTP